MLVPTIITVRALIKFQHTDSAHLRSPELEFAEMEPQVLNLTWVIFVFHRLQSKMSTNPEFVVISVISTVHSFSLSHTPSLSLFVCIHN